MMQPDKATAPADVDGNSPLPAPPLANSDRLRSHLMAGGLAAALMDAWSKDDPQAQARMLAVLHDFHKPK